MRVDGTTSARLVLGAIVALAFLVRAVFLARAGSNWAYNDDSYYYLALARGLRHGCGFAPLDVRCGPPEIVRTPGYPAFLAPFAADLRAVVLAQAALGALTTWLAASFVRRTHGTRAAAIAGACVAGDALSILLSKEIMSEALCQFLVLAGMLLLLRPKSALRGAAGGLVLGACVLVRPVTAVLLLVAALTLVLRRRWRVAAATLATAALVTGGWAARNASRAGVFSITTEGVASLYTLTAPGVVARLTRRPFEAVRDSFDLVLQRRYHSARADSTYWGAVGEPAAAPFMRATAARVLLAHPLEVAALGAHGLAEIAFEPYMLQSGWYGTVPRSSTLGALRLLIGAEQCVLLVVVWVGALRAVRAPGFRADACSLFAAVLLLMLAAAPFPGNTGPRFRMPTVPLFAVLAGIGWGAPRLATGGGAREGRARARRV